MVRIHPDPPGFWGISSAGRAPALQAGGRRFDPVILHQRIAVFSEVRFAAVWFAAVGVHGHGASIPECCCERVRECGFAERSGLGV